MQLTAGKHSSGASPSFEDTPQLPPELQIALERGQEELLFFLQPGGRREKVMEGGVGPWYWSIRPFSSGGRHILCLCCNRNLPPRELAEPSIRALDSRN